MYNTDTINMKFLNKFQTFKCPPSYSLDRSSGNGCFLDPPGYPTYFTRNVWTKYGNSPHKGAQLVLFGKIVEHSNDWKGCKNWDEYRERINTRMRKLYIPLPIEHQRVRGWINTLYKYFNHCYQDDSVENASNVDKLITFPVPYYKLKSFKDDPRFSDEWREKEKASIEQYNKEVIEKAAKIAKPENHRAVRVIQEIYPDYLPELDLIENPVKQTGNWWERYAERFTPENCPGKYSIKHPVNGNWCQMCGWNKDEK